MKAIIEQGEDGTYGIYLEDNKYNLLIIGNGKSINEALEDFYICRDEMKAFYEKEGKVFPKIEFNFQYEISKNQI